MRPARISSGDHVSDHEFYFEKCAEEGRPGCDAVVRCPGQSIDVSMINTLRLIHDGPDALIIRPCNETRIFGTGGLACSSRSG